MTSTTAICLLAAGLIGCAERAATPPELDPAEPAGPKGPPSLTCLTAESEDNDRDSRADGPTCPGQPVTGAVSRTGDRDWFFFDVTAAQAVEISLDHAGTIDLDWHLYGETGSWIARGTSSAVPELGTHELPGAGRYFVRVSAWSGTGAYTLSIRGDGDSPDDPPADPPGSCSGTRPQPPGNLARWIVGDPADRCVEPGGPALLLTGGGLDVTEAFSNRAAPVLAGGDIVVLRTSGSDGYNDYLHDLTGADSVETLVVDTRSKASHAYVAWAVRNAEMVWMAGGDQSEYLDAWAGTAVETAIRHVYDRGGVVGGASAGMAVLGERAYDPDGVPSAYSDEAVGDPCDPYIILSPGLLDVPLLAGIITDTHFYERDRLGRLVTFMARMVPPLGQTEAPVTGIGIDEGTSLWLSADGVGRVDGDGAVYVLREGPATERTQLACGAPLVYAGLVRHALQAGDSFDFGTGAGTGETRTVGIDGRNAQFYVPTNPY